jgi:uncharacterized protein (TIGR03083 family)
MTSELARVASDIERTATGMVQLVASGMVVDAFGAEAERLSESVSGTDEASFTRPSPCPPWTVGELLYHVRIAAGRVPGMLAGPEPAEGPLVSAVGYYRPGQRFSSAANTDRIAAARRGAAALATGTAIVGDFEQAWRQSWVLIRAAPQARVVRTRHGDRMLLTEFVCTRVLELAVHGLDLAAGLGRRPWMTTAAARVLAGLLLPAGTTARMLLDETGWDQITMIAKATGRIPLTAAETTLIRRYGIRRLALG